MLSFSITTPAITEPAIEAHRAENFAMVPISVRL